MGSKGRLKIGVALLVVAGLTAALMVTRARAQRPAEGVVNGINTATLNATIGQLKEHPEGGRVTFHTRTRWQDGMRCFTDFNGYRLDGNMLHEERRFVLLGDEGTELGGTDAAPGGIELLMYALGTCITATANANAALMGVDLTRFEVNAESDLDVHGLLALNPQVRPGIINLRLQITIAGDADEATLRKIARAGYQYSPVADTLRNSVEFQPVVNVVK